MKSNKSVFLWIGTLAVLGAIVWGLSYVVALPAQKHLEEPQSLSTGVRTDDHVSGSGTVILIEYADYQCPACGAYYPVLKQLENTFAGKVTFVYRYFPLFQIHVNANYSAYAAEAAGLQGKFWQMHDLLFVHQNDWAERADAKEIFKGYAMSLGLDSEKFVSDMSSDVVRARVSRNYDEADRLGLPGTPSFFLNGKKIDNPKNYEAFKALIQQSIK